MVSLPPWGMASRAFSARFTITCSIWPRSARTAPRSGAGAVTRSTSSPINRRSNRSMSVTTRFRSRTAGCRIWRRLYASSWRVRPAAREPAHRLHLLRLAQLVLESLDLGDVALRAPGALHHAVLHDPHEVVQERLGLAVRGPLVGLDVRQSVAGAREGAQHFFVVGVGPDEQVAEPRADELLRRRETVHLGHRVIALGEVAVPVEVLDLLRLGQVDGERLVELQAPDAFG